MFFPIIFSWFGFNDDEPKRKRKRKSKPKRNTLRSSNEYVNQITDIFSNCIDKKRNILYARDEIDKILYEQRLDGFLIRDADDKDTRYVALRKNFIEVMSDLAKTKNGLYTIFIDQGEATRSLLVKMDAAEITKDIFISSKLSVVVIEDYCWECIL